MFNVRMYLDYIINYILMSFLQRKGKDILLLLSPIVLLHCCGHSSQVTSDQTPKPCSLQNKTVSTWLSLRNQKSKYLENGQSAVDSDF